ncbi:MAG: hypothetical protein ABW040_02920, partial [Microbacteriaceae bacterium]
EWRDRCMCCAADIECGERKIKACGDSIGPRPFVPGPYPGDPGGRISWVPSDGWSAPRVSASHPRPSSAGARAM